jgi:hypothetical protein
MFVLRFCARPLAGPPVGRTDSAIAPDLQASANFNFLLNFAEKLFVQLVAQISLSLAESFASSIRISSNFWTTFEPRLRYSDQHICSIREIG